jgi:hypothetical protein
MPEVIIGVVKNGVVIPNAPLPEGTCVEIHVQDTTAIPPDLQEVQGQRISMWEFLQTLPPGPSPRAFPTWEEYERHLQEEKDAWER